MLLIPNFKILFKTLLVNLLSKLGVILMGETISLVFDIDEFSVVDELPEFEEHSVKERSVEEAEGLSEFEELFTDSRIADMIFSEFNSAKSNESNISTKSIIRNRIS